MIASQEGDFVNAPAPPLILVRVPAIVILPLLGVGLLAMHYINPHFDSPVLLLLSHELEGAM